LARNRASARLRRLRKKNLVRCSTRVVHRLNSLSPLSLSLSVAHYLCRSNSSV
jgi:hypothetical protein